MVEGQTNTHRSMDAHEADESAQSLIEEANNAAARTEAANKEAKALLAQLNSARIREQLEGKSLANLPPQKLEETPKEYADRIMRTNF